MAHRSLERQTSSKETREKIKSSPGVKFPSVAEVTTAFEKTSESAKGPISLDVHVEMLGHIGKKLYERQELEAENIAETCKKFQADFEMKPRSLTSPLSTYAFRLRGISFNISVKLMGKLAKVYTWRKASSF